MASIAACMREANPALKPQRLKELLMLSASAISGAPFERQGAGVVDAGLAVAAALADKGSGAMVQSTPRVEPDVVRFTFHDHSARSVQLRGSWNGWHDALEVQRVGDGIWEGWMPRPGRGRYSYKFLVDGSLWLVDPSNPLRTVDDAGNVNRMLVAP